VSVLGNRIVSTVSPVSLDCCACMLAFMITAVIVRDSDARKKSACGHRGNHMEWLDGVTFVCISTSSCSCETTVGAATVTDDLAPVAP